MEIIAVILLAVTGIFLGLRKISSREDDTPTEVIEELKRAEPREAEEARLKEEAQRQLEEQKLKVQSQNARALYEQGMKYYYDTLNYDEAVSCFHKAAELGNADAQYRLGKMYTAGDKVKKDWEEAAKWYRRAAEQGHIDAQEAMAHIYRNGYGVEQDSLEADRWFDRAHKQRKATRPSLDEALSRLGHKWNGPRY